jgi:hypothetical protein
VLSLAETDDALASPSPPRGHRQNPYHDYLALVGRKQQLLNTQRCIADRRKELTGMPTVAPGGWSCTGAWYLGVVSNGGNTNLGWSIVEDAIDPRRVAARALSGAGLSPYASFYSDHARQPVPYLHRINFGRLQHEFAGRTRHRESALGIGLGDPPQSDASFSVVDLCRELPEMLSELVRRVLRDDRSNAKHTAPDFVRGEIERVLNVIAARSA